MFVCESGSKIALTSKTVKYCQELILQLRVLLRGSYCAVLFRGQNDVHSILIPRIGFCRALHLKLLRIRARGAATICDSKMAPML